MFELSSIYCYSDGGKSESLTPEDDNACTVIATTIAFETIYDVAYAALKVICGRTKKRGIPFVREIYRLGKTFGKNIADLIFTEKYVFEFCLRHPEGTYIIETKRHVAAVKNGVLYDYDSETLTCKLIRVWEII